MVIKKPLPDGSNNNRLFKGALAYSPIYLIVFCAFFDTHAQMPVLAPYTLNLGATPFMLGLVVGAYSLFNIIGNFAGGAAIDRHGWQSPLLIGLFGVSLFLFSYTLAEKATSLLLSRAGHGLMGGILVPAALACITQGRESNATTPPSHLALFGAAIGFAAVSGPMASGITANALGYEAVYYGLALLMLVAACGALLFSTKKGPCLVTRGPQLLSYRDIILRPEMQALFLFALGTMGSTGVLAAFLPIRSALLGFNPARLGSLFATFALAAITIQLIWPKIVKPRLRQAGQGSIAGLAMLGLALVLGATLNNAAALFAVMILYGTGFGLSFQDMLTLLYEASQPAWRGRASGLFFAAYSLGVALLPPLSGLMWQQLPALFPFYTASASAFICLAAGRALQKNHLALSGSGKEYS